MKSRGLKDNAAERLFEKWLELEGWHVARAGVRTKFRCFDLFGCLDFLAFRTTLPDGTHDFRAPCDAVWGVQTTTQEGREKRRRKIEQVPWPRAWRVSIASHERVPDPADRKRSLHFWRVEDYFTNTTPRWGRPVAVPFDLAAIEEIDARAAEQRHQDEMAEIRARIAEKEAAR